MKIYTLLFLLLVYSSTQAQVLQTTNLNLNSGGVIHDVAYDSYYDAYIVVGDFSSIGGQTRNNLAFIDAQTLAVLPQASITSINGAILSVEVINFVPHFGAPGAGFRNYIYLGGNFTSINTNAKISIARLTSTHYYSQPPAGGLANYNLQLSWDAEFNDYSILPEAGVHDLLISGDTLIACGKFSNSAASYIAGGYEDLNAIAFDANSTAFARLPMFSSSTSTIISQYAGNVLKGVRKLNNRYFLFGSEDLDEIIYEYTPNGTFVQNIEDCGSVDIVDDFEIHASSVDTLLFSYEEVGGGVGNDWLVSYQEDGTVYHCPTGAPSNTILNYPAMGLTHFLETYDDFIFTSSSNQLFTSKRNGVVNVPILKTFNLNSTWMNGYPSLNAAPCLKRVENLLFLSSNNLSSVDGTPQNGLAVFCLEPSPAEAFTQSDPSACENDSSTYTIPVAQCADGYRWSYSGSGALYRITGSGNAWATLTSNDIVDQSANSIDVLYTAGATGGTLSVEPFTLFAAGEYSYSQAESIAITINPKPDVILDPTHSLNCYSDTTLIVAQSSMANVNFDWVFNNGGNTSTNDTILITNQNSNGIDSSNYIVTVTNSTTGCSNSDTTFFTFDTTATQLDVSLTTLFPNEWTCTTDSMVLTSNQPNYLITWENPANIGTFYSDPFTIYSAPNGYYNIHGIEISNGCSTQAAYGGISVNTLSADGMLTGYNYINGSSPIDTLNCSNDSITLQCDVTAPFTSNSTAQWLDSNSTPTGSDQMTLTQADANGANFVVVTFRTFNNDNGCTSDHDVLIAFDFNPPLVAQLADQTMNCSQSEIVLTHPISGTSSVIEGWLDQTGAQTGADTIVVLSTGNYYYQVQSTLNGCTNVDTVSIDQSLDLLLDMPSDTLICPDQIVSIAPSVIGNTETPSFLWSTGSTNSSETATGGIDSQLIVTISTPSGCTGTDSTTILITAPIDATITPFAGCTDGSLEVTGVVGGAGNYQYSIDGSTWQTSTNFAGLSFGSYTVFIQDDLGCVYDFDQSLDGTASTIEMLYVASTYNQEGDTIVLVNVTDFTGLDSVSWVLPIASDVIFETDSMVILSMATGGWYDIDLVGYLGASCEYTYTASVYFGDHAPVFDSTLTANGIESFVVSPNPTTGSFDVALEFGTAQNYSIVITNSIGQPIGAMNVSGTGTIVNHSFNFPIGTPVGAYRIHVIADYDAQQKMIILN